MLWRGMRRCCPNCGSGGLFRRWFRMAERCPRCGYRFVREDGFHFGGYVEWPERVIPRNELPGRTGHSESP